MKDLSVIIPARNEQFLKQTIENVLLNIEADTEIIAILDGYWPNPPIFDNNRVIIVHHTKPIGQRAATNEGVRISQAKYIMKLDAHCAVDKGFDRKLMEDCEYNWTIVPMMYSLHAFDWQCNACGNRTYQGFYPKICKKCNKNDGFKMIIIWKPRRGHKTSSWQFDKNMQFQYWPEAKHRQELYLKEGLLQTMSFIGACWFMDRKRYLDIEGLDEKHGSWGQVGTEIACKTWLSGGQLITNRKTWFAHMFRTGNFDGFPYQISGNDQKRAREYSRDLWLNDKWPKAKYPLKWLVDKFAPVPDWHNVKAI